MTTTPRPEQRRLPASEEHKAKMRRIAREANARLGIPEKPTMTHDELMASMLASGIRPEDNSASRELLRMRYGDDYDQDEYMRNLDKQTLDAQALDAQNAKE